MPPTSIVLLVICTVRRVACFIATLARIAFVANAYEMLRHVDNDGRRTSTSGVS